MKQYKIAYLLIALTAMFASCTEDGGPSIDDHFLNYEIPDVPVTQDCVVGAYFVDPGSNGLSDAIWGRLTSLEFDPANGLYSPAMLPVTGNWKHGNFPNSSASNPTPLQAMVELFQQEIDWAVEAGIDFFILPMVGEDANRLYPST